MGFNPADFRTQAGQGEATADQVRHYLQEEEDHFLDSILHAFQITLDEDALIRRGKEGISSRFGEAIDSVIARVEASLKGERERLSPQELQIVIAHVRAACRHYEDILDGCASQLFSELEKLRVDEVGEDTIQSVEIVKDKLVKQINDFIQQVWRLEKKLTAYRSKIRGEWRLLGWLRSFTKPVIDRGITSKLKRIRKTMNQSFHQLRIRHVEYCTLEEWAAKKRATLERFSIFQALPIASREKFSELYRLLKMLKRSESTSEFIVEELNRLLRETIQTEEAINIFTAYADALRKAFFVLRRGIPQELDASSDVKETKQEIAVAIQANRREVRVLGSMLYRYRDFILNTHPDPYVRARLGFAESTVGPEPDTTKRLVRLGHRVEALDKHYYKLSSASEEYDPTNPPTLELGYFDETVEDLDELLLAAKRPQEARDRYQEVFSNLEKADELTTFDSYRVMGVEKVLRLALRLDYFNVLVKEKRFVTLYENHLNIRESISDPEQRDLLAELKKLGEQPEEWLEVADRLLTVFEEYLKKKKEEAPISFERVMGEVRVKRFGVLEFLYLSRQVIRSLRDMKRPVPFAFNRVSERVNAIEADFAYLISHLGRSRGPMTLKELRCLENQ